MPREVLVGPVEADLSVRRRCENEIVGLCGRPIGSNEGHFATGRDPRGDRSLGRVPTDEVRRRPRYLLKSRRRERIHDARSRSRKRELVRLWLIDGRPLPPPSSYE